MHIHAACVQDYEDEQNLAARVMHRLQADSVDDHFAILQVRAWPHISMLTQRCHAHLSTCMHACNQTRAEALTPRNLCDTLLCGRLHPLSSRGSTKMAQAVAGLGQGKLSELSDLSCTLRLLNALGQVASKHVMAGGNRRTRTAPALVFAALQTVRRIQSGAEASVSPQTVRPPALK